jgi:amidase
MNDPAFMSAKNLARAIRRREIGCLEILDHYLSRIGQYNKAINAVIVRDEAGARKRARAADRALAKGEVWGPLHGVPMTMKESFDIAGMPTTWGIPALKDNIAARDSHAAERYRAAGVTLFGKTNVPFGLADWQSFNAIYGTTSNPWDLARSPGGSSGGAAAALCAGLTGIEAGSDIGASIRNPPHYCGVYGHKPTFGIVPSDGHRLPGVYTDSDIAMTGPMGRSADDLALGLSLLAGPGAIDARAWRLALPASPKKRIRDFRVAIMTNDRNAEVDNAVQAELVKLGAFLRKAGAKVSFTARPDIDTDDLQQTYLLMLRATTSQAQTAAQVAAFEAQLAASDPADRSYRARMARGVTLRHRDYLDLDNARHRMRLAWDAFFRDYDLFLCPAASSAAFPHDHVGDRADRTIEVNGKRVPTTDQLFWAGISGLFYLPATVAPAGETPGGLPVGVQIIGAQFADHTCIKLAQLLEREFRGFVPPPLFS